MIVKLLLFISLVYYAQARYVGESQNTYEDEVNAIIQDLVQYLETRLEPIVSRMDDSQKDEFTNFALPAFVAYIKNMARDAYPDEEYDEDEGEKYGYGRYGDDERYYENGGKEGHHDGYLEDYDRGEERDLFGSEDEVEIFRFLSETLADVLSMFDSDSDGDEEDNEEEKALTENYDQDEETQSTDASKTRETTPVANENADQNPEKTSFTSLQTDATTEISETEVIPVNKAENSEYDAPEDDGSFIDK